jgi:hypothetical protein
MAGSVPLTPPGDFRFEISDLNEHLQLGSLPKGNLRFEISDLNEHLQLGSLPTGNLRFKISDFRLKEHPQLGSLPTGNLRFKISDLRSKSITGSAAWPAGRATCSSFVFSDATPVGQPDGAKGRPPGPPHTAGLEWCIDIASIM